MLQFDPQAHWENIHATKPANAVSWYRPHLDSSLAFIEQAKIPRSASIIDVGCGQSTLISDLLTRGYTNITALDISTTAISLTQQRLGPSASKIRWLVGNILDAALQPASFDLWHDRAVFHFLTTRGQRVTYFRNLVTSLRPGAQIILSTFGPNGPTQCSGLDVVRFDAQSLLAELGPRFELLISHRELHSTPFATTQQFETCLFRLATFTSSSR
jgi:2-polyprenyl-3-methyl-5-hydroxy-6-metoxy-1,4-benzoquinol methylase